MFSSAEEGRDLIDELNTEKESTERRTAARSKSSACEPPHFVKILPGLTLAWPLRLGDLEAPLKPKVVTFIVASAGIFP
jgi:hypothetical protein